MLPSLRVTGFRDLKSLSVDRLARINLFVGDNNSGKTSLLEAVEVLLGLGEPHALYAGCLRREETMDLRDIDLIDVAVRHLFHGHDLAPGATFSVDGGEARSVEVRVTDRSSHLPGGPDGQGSLALQVRARANGAEQELTINLSPAGNARHHEGPRAHASKERAGDVRYSFVATSGFTSRSLAQLWDEVVLSPEEALVVDVLRIIEPTIDRIAGVDRTVSSGVFMLRMRDSKSRVPLGSMGDGIKRLFSLAICLARSAGGALLIDEIDTGLHHSVMTRMWRLVAEAARRLDVQVFATTHSLDCLNALGELYEDDPALGGEVLLHRIERGREQTTLYEADELLEIARHRIEVRGVRR